MIRTPPPDTPAAPLTVFYHGKDIAGWVPITHLVDLTCRLLGGGLQQTGDAPISQRALLGRWLRQAPPGGDKGALFIARSPNEVRQFLSLPTFPSPWRFRALWIIDSFRTSDLPSPRLLSQFDVVAYCQAYDRPIYEAAVGERALLLPWGTNALELGSWDRPRPYDVLRLGRQPDAWEDDARSTKAAAGHGLTFHGRPPFVALSDMQRALMQDWYGQAKFIIAHSNLAAPAPYTHPTKEYITARWTDAIAAGAVVAGAQPHRDLALLDWPEATVDFKEIHLERNFDQLAGAVADWRPETALRNHIGALERLDWRWRLKTLCARLGIEAPALQRDLLALNTRISILRQTL